MSLSLAQVTIQSLRCSSFVYKMESLAVHHWQQGFAVVFKDYVALQLVECWGDDVPAGEVTSFPLAVQCKDDETVVFSWIIWPCKDSRHAGMDKVMNDDRMSDEKNPMPFDGQRLIYGGFQMMLSE